RAAAEPGSERERRAADAAREQKPRERGHEPKIEVRAEAESRVHAERGAAHEPEHGVHDLPAREMRESESRDALAQRKQRRDERETEERETARLLQRRLAPDRVPAPYGSRALLVRRDEEKRARRDDG